MTLSEHISIQNVQYNNLHNMSPFEPTILVLQDDLGLTEHDCRLTVARLSQKRGLVLTRKKELISETNTKLA